LNEGDYTGLYFTSVVPPLLVGKESLRVYFNHRVLLFSQLHLGRPTVEAEPKEQLTKNWELTGYGSERHIFTFYLTLVKLNELFALFFRNRESLMPDLSLPLTKG